MKRWILALLLASPAAKAATLNVTTTADELNTDGDCSLREAIQSVNSGQAIDVCAAPDAGGNTISLPAGTYALTLAGTNENANQTGDLNLTAGVTIAGAGAGKSIIDATGIDRILKTSAPLTVKGLTFANGLPPTNSVGDTPHGGAIRTTTSLTIEDCEFKDNAAGAAGASHGPGSGGAVYIDGGSLTIKHSQFLRNRAGGATSGAAGAGGAVWSGANALIGDSLFDANQGGSTAGGGQKGNGGAVELLAFQMEIDRSTFTNNRTGDWDSYGGAIDIRGGVTTIRDSYFASNHAVGGGAVYGSDPVLIINSTITGHDVGALSSYYTPFTIVNSTLVENSGGALTPEGAMASYTVQGSILGQNGGRDCYYWQGFGGLMLADNGHNLFEAGSSCPWAASSNVSVDSLSSVVDTTPALNGGATKTMKLLAGSAAIDAGVCTDGTGAPLATDQRGAPRQFGAGCDIGAFELRDPGLVVTTTAEPAGANCAAGGTKISIYNDANATGMVDGNETVQVSFVCNGANGSDGENGENAAQMLVNAEPFPANTVGECPNGGVALMVGADVNGNEALDEEEVQSTSFICTGAAGQPGNDGKDGVNSLVKISAIEAGNAQCPAGGQRIDTGLDNGAGGGVRGDGVLQSGEVTASTPVCNGAAGTTGDKGADGKGGCASAPASLLGMLALVLARRRR